MNSIENARSEQNKRCDALAALRAEFNNVSVQIVDLKEKRAAAVMLLATGQKEKGAEVSDIESLLVPLNLQAEGLSLAIADAEKNIQAAESQIAELEVQREAEIGRLFQEEEQKRCAEIKSGLGDRVKNICDLYMKLISGLAELQVDGVKVPEAAAELFKMFPTLNTAVIGQGFRHLAMRGFPYDIPVNPMIVYSSPDGSSGPVNVLEVSSARDNTIRMQLAQQFDRKSA